MLLSKGQVQKLVEGLNKTPAIATQKTDQEHMNVTLIMPTHLVELSQVFNFMSNYYCANNPRLISNQFPSIAPVTTQGLTFFSNTFPHTEVTKWYIEMPQEEVLELGYHPTTRADYFLLRVAATGLKHNTKNSHRGRKTREHQY